MGLLEDIGAAGNAVGNWANNAMNANREATDRAGAGIGSGPGGDGSVVGYITTSDGEMIPQTPTVTQLTDSSNSPVVTKEQTAPPSTQASDIITYGTASVPKALSERAGYYAPSELGDTGTQDLIKKGYSVDQALAEQYAKAAANENWRTAAYYKNEADKSKGSDVAVSSQFHATAQKSGLPYDYNPFEYRGDRARAFLESSQGVDNTSDNVKGDKKPSYDAQEMLAQANALAKIERTGDAGGYQNTQSYSSNFGGHGGILTLQEKQSEAAKAGRWADWNVDRTPSGEADNSRIMGLINPNFARSQGFDMKYREAGIDDSDVAGVLDKVYMQKQEDSEHGVGNASGFFAQNAGRTPEEVAAINKAKLVVTDNINKFIIKSPTGTNELKVSPTMQYRYTSDGEEIPITTPQSSNKPSDLAINNDFLKSALVGGGAALVVSNPITGGFTGSLVNKYIKLPEGRSSDSVKVGDFGAITPKNNDVVKVGNFGEPNNFRIEKYTTKVGDFNAPGSKNYGNDMIQKTLVAVRPAKTAADSNEPVVDVMAGEREKSAQNIAGIRSGALDVYGGASNAYNASKTYGVRTPSGGLSVNMGSGVSAVALPRRAKKSQPQIKREVYIPSTLNVLNNVLINKSTKATVLSPKGSGVGNANFNGLSDSFIKNTVKATGINIGGVGKKSSSNNIANNINDLVGIINKKQKPTNTTKSKRK
jgi:hypothetical protein